MKKSDERRAVTEFLQLQKFSAEIFERESPDFELRFSDGMVVGLEVSELADETLAKGDATTRRLDVAVAAALQRAGLNLGVTISFHAWKASTVGASRVFNETVARIVELAHQHSKQTEAESVYDEVELRRHGLHESIRMLRFTNGSGVLIGKSGMGIRGSVAHSRVREKTAKLPEYRSKLAADEYWLLLVSGQASRNAVWSEMFEHDEYATEFDRVYCVDFWASPARVLELKRRPG